MSGLLEKEAWVMDGNYLGSLEWRLSFADTVILLEFNRFTCLSRCLKRLVQNWGQVRTELPEGCTEKMDWDFLKWIWNYPNNLRPEILKRLRQKASHHQVIVLHNDREIREFLDSAPRLDPLAPAAPPSP